MGPLHARERAQKMRNYILIFMAHVQFQLRNPPHTIDDEFIVTGDADDFNDQLDSLLSAFSGAWNVNFIAYKGPDGMSPGCYWLLDKDNLITMVSSTGTPKSVIFNSANISSTSPRDSWSHGH